MNWQPMATEPCDGKFRLYGLHVRNNQNGHEWFEVYYLQQDVEGQMIEPGGDSFSAWGFDDFEVWADAPQPPTQSGS